MRPYVAWFNFRAGDQQQRRVGARSGGERNRVHRARRPRGVAGLLLLDEPTNDLDVDTLRALDGALVEAFDANSEVVWFAGNHAD